MMTPGAWLSIVFVATRNTEAESRGGSTGTHREEQFNREALDTLHGGPCDPGIEGERIADLRRQGPKRIFTYGGDRQGNHGFCIFVASTKTRTVRICVDMAHPRISRPYRPKSNIRVIWQRPAH